MTLDTQTANITAHMKSIVHNSAHTNDQKINDLLQYGLSIFNLSTGIVSYVEDDIYTVKYFQPAESGLSVGQTFDLGITYCAITLKLGIPVGIPHMNESDYNRHPCYEAFQLESYFGLPILVNNDRYGTLNFSSPEPRRKFSVQERQWLQEMSFHISELLS